MKLIIDIPDEMYDWAINYNKFYQTYSKNDLLEVIQNGKPVIIEADKKLEGYNCEDCISRQAAKRALQSRYIDEFPNINELVYKVINRVPIIDRYVNQEINRVLDKIRAEIEARLCDVVSDYTDGYRTAIQGDLAIIDKYQTQRYTLQTVPEKTSVEFELEESEDKE